MASRMARKKPGRRLCIARLLLRACVASRFLSLHTAAAAAVCVGWAVLVPVLPVLVPEGLCAPVDAAVEGAATSEEATSPVFSPPVVDMSAGEARFDTGGPGKMYVALVSNTFGS